MPEGEGWRTQNSFWLDMEGEGEDEVFRINVVIGEEAGRGLHPPPCLTFEEEFIALRLRQKIQMKRKTGEGDFVPKYRTEEEKYSFFS